ncbi:MAG: ABC transporter permease [Atribacterota bacterium]|nr:ABC transporter permease [Atribacterota bacterium]MDD4895592.1 ABC transporter permease [Atribacterota bacterium]MDD5636843.1 ABC transporter permease [Atribacterota bacterium]
MKGNKNLSSLISENFVWILLILLWFFAGMVNKAFFSYLNIVNLLVHSIILGILTLGGSLCLISGFFDLTVESTLVFTGLLAGWLISSDSLASGLLLNPVLTIIIMLITGFLIGIINGLLVAYQKMNPFITTLAMSIVLTGLSVYISKGKSIYPLNSTFNYLGGAKIYGLPVSIIFLIFLYILFHIILTYTPLGRKFYAIGSNIDAARAAGINVELTVLTAYALSGLLAACAGWVLAGRLNSVSSHMSSGLIMYIFAAAVIGGVKLSGGRGRILGIFGGVLLISSVNNFMNLSHVNAFLIQATTGFIILIAMFIDTMKENYFLSNK